MPHRAGPPVVSNLDSDPTLERMQRLLQGWAASADRRRIFLNCYLLMTRNMLIAIDAGEFADRVWVGALLRRFAGYYFDALEAYEAGQQTVPAVWRITHDAAQDPGPLTLQHLLLGVNAHINYDLALTLVDMLETEWPQLDQHAREQRYADHSHVNRVISRTIDTVQDEVIERVTPGMDWVDKAMGRSDEWLAAYLISRWRDQVWQHALSMLAAPDAPSREERRRSVESLTLTRAQVILGDGSIAGLRKLL